jgi:hypothetical protein
MEEGQNEVFIPIFSKRAFSLFTTAEIYFFPKGRG